MLPFATLSTKAKIPKEGHDEINNDPSDLFLLSR